MHDLGTAGRGLSEALALTAERVDLAAGVLVIDRVDLAAGVLVFATLTKRQAGIYRAVPVPPALLERARPGARHPRASGPPRQGSVGYVSGRGRG